MSRQHTRVRSGRGSSKQTPAAPTGLTATPTGDTTIHLDWATPYSGSVKTVALSGWKVYRSTTSGSGFSLRSTVTISEYDDTVITGTTYYYKVTANGLDAESAYSAEVSATAQGDYQAPAWTIPDVDGVDANLGSVIKGGYTDLTSYYAANNGTPVFSISSITAAGGSDTSGITINSATGRISVSDTTPSDSYSLSVSLASANTAADDWAARSTGAGVVWAHNFDYEAEVTAHLGFGSSDAKYTGIVPRRVVDESGIGCLEQVAIGATLAQNYTAGSPTMVIDDATYWPTSGFYFQVCRAYPNVGNKNLFYCTSRSGTTLTVQYVDMSAVSAYATTAQSYVVGDYAGNEVQNEWRRVFSALPAGENGLPSNDPAANGTVPIRSRVASTPTYGVPRDNGIWQYGFYGHPNNQALWGTVASPWVPWQGVTTYTPRGGAAGTKNNPWDGSEFWIQFRMKVDPRFWLYHAQPDPNGTTELWGRKTWALQSEFSSVNQLVMGIAPSNRFGIPDTNESPFSLLTYKASRTVGVSDYARSRVSHQMNSPWDVAPHYANLSSSFKPSTGCPTPDGSAAWEMKDGEWVTFLIHVIPGRSNVAESTIEVKFARTEDPAYDGTYTTLLSVTDGRIVYSGSGDYDYPDGSFAYPTVTTMNALPGFQAFGLMGYFNINQTVGIPPPKASYYVRMAQVIFSKAEIPAPAVGA